MFPLHDDVRSRTFPWVSRSLILINILIFLYQLTLTHPQLEAFLGQFAFFPVRLTQDLAQGVLGMLTSMFLHSGWGHLLGNMWFLFIFGDNVEDRLGHFSFLVFYLVGGMIAALAQAFLGGDPSVPMIGASGAISAVLGAYLLFYPRARILTLLFIVIFFTLIRVPALFYLPYWALVQLLSSFSGQSNVAFVAHLGGFIGGLLIAVLWPKRRERITY